MFALLLLISAGLQSNDPPPLDGFSNRIAETLGAESELIARASAQMQAAREQILSQSSGMSKAQRAEAWGRLGMLYQARSVIDEAEQAYTEALSQTATFRWHYLLAYVLDQRGDTESAITHYQQALKFRPNDVLARLRLGVALSVTGNPQAALTALNRADRLAADSAVILAALADVYIANEQWDQARRHLQRAVDLDPAAGQLAYKLALVYRRLGDSDNASKWLAKRNMSGPGMADPLLMEVLQNSPDFHVAAAERAWKRGQFDEALDAYNQAIALVPADTGIRLAAAYTLRELARQSEAIDQAMGVLAQDPKFASAWHLLAEMLVESAEIHKAYNAARQATELFDELGADGTFQDQEAARGLFAALAMHTRQFASAAASYQVLINRHPDNAYYRYWLGMAWLAQGRCEATRPMLAEVLKMNPNWGEAHLVHTRAQALCGDAQARRSAFARALALFELQDDSDTRITRAYTELGVGHIDQARALATAELPHPDAAMLLDALARNKMPPLPFAEDSSWWLPEEARSP